MCRKFIFNKFWQTVADKLNEPRARLLLYGVRARMITSSSRWSFASAKCDLPVYKNIKSHCTRWTDPETAAGKCEAQSAAASQPCAQRCEQKSYEVLMWFILGNCSLSKCAALSGGVNFWTNSASPMVRLFPARPGCRSSSSNQSLLLSTLYLEPATKNVRCRSTTLRAFESIWATPVWWAGLQQANAPSFDIQISSFGCAAATAALLLLLRHWATGH